MRRNGGLLRYCGDLVGDGDGPGNCPVSALGEVFYHGDSTVARGSFSLLYSNVARGNGKRGSVVPTRGLTGKCGFVRVYHDGKFARGRVTGHFLVSRFGSVMAGRSLRSTFGIFRTVAPGSERTVFGRHGGLNRTLIARRVGAVITQLKVNGRWVGGCG